MGEAETGEEPRSQSSRGGKKYRRLVGEAETGEESKASRVEEERSTGD